MDPKRCSRCGSTKDRSLFISVKGMELKTCQNCREGATRSVCPHKIKRSQCKICIKNCPHGKRPSRCIICDGHCLCPHFKVKSSCKDCGDGVCFHGIFKRNCVICEGCPHGKRKYYCIDCGGKGLCECGKRRYMCKKCGGGGICLEHGNQRSSCKECKGSALCACGKQKYFCKKCLGKGLCIHLKQFRACVDCRGVDAVIFKMYHRSKTSDVFRDREFDLDYDFLKALIEASSECYYCGEELNYVKRRDDDGATIERLDNTIGHTKENCVIACWKCNKKHNKTRFHEDYTPEEQKSPGSS